MKRNAMVVMVFALLLFAGTFVSWADTTLPEKKQTDLGLYVTAKEAYAKWCVEPDKIKFLDVRTLAEYIFVGHAPMATNIPLKFFNGGIDPKTMQPVMLENKNFVDEVKKKYKKDDVILVMCRSGARSAAAVDELAKAGFVNAYSIVDGFEGDKLEASGSYRNGQRIVNGWKNSGAPWTYQLDPRIVYLP